MNKVRPGDKLTAKSYNELIDTVEELRESPLYSNAKGKNNIPCTISNTTSGTIQTGGTLAISGMRGGNNLTPSEAKQRYQSSGIQLIGTSVTSSTLSSKIAQATEMIGAGKIGKCQVPNITATMVSGMSTARDYVTPSSSGFSGTQHTTEWRVIGYSLADNNGKRFCYLSYVGAVGEQGVYYNDTLCQQVSAGDNVTLAAQGSGDSHTLIISSSGGGGGGIEPAIPIYSAFERKGTLGNNSALFSGEGLYVTEVKETAHADKQKGWMINWSGVSVKTESHTGYWIVTTIGTAPVIYLDAETMQATIDNYGIHISAKMPTYSLQLRDSGTAGDIPVLTRNPGTTGSGTLKYLRLVKTLPTSNSNSDNSSNDL